MATDVNFGQQQYFGFDPRAIPSCMLWLDAADSNSLVLTGGLVTTWNDKSGGGRNATANTGITLNASGLGTGYPALTFTSSQWLTGSVSITGTTLSIFSIFSLNSLSPFAARVIALAASEANDYNNVGYMGLLRQSAAAMGPYRNGTYTSTSTPYSTRVMNTTYFDGTNQYTSTNGGTLASNPSSGTFAVSTYRIANNTNTGDSGAAAFYGFIGEVIVYNTALTATQRQQVEGYLAWKWGLNSSLGISHAYKTNPPIMRLFQPVDILNCAIWVDPADRSSVTGLSGNQPTAIRSKGHQAITLDNVQPVNNAGTGPWIGWPPPATTNYGTQFMTNSSSNLNTLQFTRTVGSGGQYGNGYQGSYLRVPSVTFTNQQRTMFYVHSAQATGLDSYAHMFAPTTWSGQRQRGFHDYGQTAYIMFPLADGGSTQVLVAGGVAPYSGFQPTNGTPYIFGLRHTTSTATSYVSVNGTQTVPPLANLALTTGYTTETNEYVIGIWAGYTRQFLMGDFLLYDGAIQDSEIQQLEGYLAWKWGLRSSLPTTHPFRNFQPATPLFVPTTFTGCTLWLDASELSTLTLSGSSVSSWTDKSGTTSLTQSTSSLRPTYVSNGFNGRPTVQFTGVQGSSYQYLQSATTSVYNSISSFTFFAVMRVVSTPPVFPSPISLQNKASFYLRGLNNSSGFSGDNIWTYQGSTFVASPNTTFTYDANTIACLALGSTQQFFVNGSPTVSSPSFTFGSGTNLSVLLGWSGYNANDGFNGYMSEVIIYTTPLTESQRKRVEGYLAWKWGLQNNLPTNHPYSKFRP